MELSGQQRFDREVTALKHQLLTLLLERKATGNTLLNCGPLRYKVSRRGESLMDRAALVLEEADAPFEVLPWEPYGYDERQYGSPGFDPWTA